MKKVSVILPTYNEKEIILDVIKELKENIKNPLEIIVIDDDSTDKTWEIVKEADIQGVKVIRRIASKGLASAISHGINSASGDIIVWMDADMSHPPKLVPEMIRTLDIYAIATASRYAAGGKDTRKTIRKILSKIINVFACLLLSFKVQDWTTGFVATRRSVFKDVKLITNGYGQYCIHFLYSCIQRGYQIREIGFVNKSRMKGKSKTNDDLKGILGFGYNYTKEVIKTMWIK